MNIASLLKSAGPDKLEELVLYIAKMSEKDPRFLSTKLNKLVWAADFSAFCETGRTITGAPYQRGDHGPIPRAMLIVLQRLVKEKRLKLEVISMGGMSGKRPVALEQANTSAFSQQDLARVGKVVAENFGKTGTKMSADTHKYLAWKVAKNGEEIPFPAWLVYKPLPSEEHERIGREIDAELAADEPVF